VDQINYNRVVKQTILSSPYYRFGSKTHGVETTLIADDENGVYHLLDVGWRDRKRVTQTFLLVRVKDGKIWIEEDWTEDGIASDLMKAGVPKQDIVLAFLHPSDREESGFTVA
jgi:hypothetical protein